MLITKFNKMIRNKILWGIFAGLVVVSFVWAFAPGSRYGSGRTRTTGDVRAEGKLNGQPVSVEDFREARFHTILSLSMMVGRPLNSITPTMEREIRKETWQRIVALRTAHDIGLGATDRDVQMAIQHDPMFAENDTYNPRRWQAFVQGFLANMDTSPRQFEEFIREQILLQKLQNMVATAIWIPPTELQDALHMYTDSFTLEYLTLKPSDVADVKVTPEDAKAFYESHTNYFVIPDMVRVKYVAWPVSNFLAEVSVSTADVINYYSEHIEEFTVRDTNDNPVAVEFGKVRDDIQAKLTRALAQTRAHDKATEFVDRLTPDRNGKAPTFDEVAAARQVTVSTSHWFTLREKLKDMGVGYDFNKSGFDLTPNPEDSFSEPIDGSNAVYVLSYGDRQESRLPSFEEAQTEVTVAATANARRQALNRRAHEVADALQKAVHAGKAFTNEVAALKFQAVRTKPFTAFDAPKELESPDLLSDVLSRKEHEVTGAIPAEDSAIIAYVAERVPSDPSAMEALRPQMVSRLNRQRARMVVRDWQEYIVASAKLEDNQAAAVPESHAGDGSKPSPDDDLDQ